MARGCQTRSRRTPPTPPSRPLPPSSRLPSPPPATAPISLSTDHTPSKLELLPDDLLDKIFEKVHDISASLSITTLVLSRRLLPFAIKPLYTSIHTYSVDQCVNLFATLKHRPVLGELTRVYEMSIYGARHGIPVSDEIVKALPMARSERRKHIRLREAALRREETLSDILPSSEEEPYDPNHWNFCDSLLRELFKLLPNLSRLDLYHKCLATGIFRALDSSESFPKLKILTMQLKVSDQILAMCSPEQRARIPREDYNQVEDQDISGYFSRVSSLDQVEFVGNLAFLPFHTKNEPSPTQLTPNSWKLKRLKLLDMSIVPDLSVLLPSFTDSLTSLTLQAQRFYRSLEDDLLLVPLSLTKLHILLGPDSCGGKSWSTPLESLEFDQSILRFEKLKELKLSGPLVSPSFWQELTKLSEVNHVIIGYHLPLNCPDLVNLIQGPRRLSKLQCICLNICHCPINKEENLTRKPRWRESKVSPDGEEEEDGVGGGETCSLSMRAGFKIYNALRRQGIGSGGNLKCALRKCDGTNPSHECSRAYAPIPGEGDCGNVKKGSRG
ncbi:hypothetical protein JCM3765_003919 [Sporobolomyces pararoseus]